MTLKGGEIMDMHKKILAFAMSLDMKELKDNRLLLLTNQPTKISYLIQTVI